MYTRSKQMAFRREVDQKKKKLLVMETIAGLVSMGHGQVLGPELQCPPVHSPGPAAVSTVFADAVHTVTDDIILQPDATVTRQSVPQIKDQLSNPRNSFSTRQPE